MAIVEKAILWNGSQLGVDSHQEIQGDGFP